VTQLIDDESPLSLAEQAHALVESDALRAAHLAEQAFEVATARDIPEGRVAALHALGFARHELGDPRAIATLKTAVRIAERHGLHRRAAMARRPLAIYLAFAGSTRAAVRQIEAACAVLDGIELARSEVARIAVLHHAGRSPDPATSERALGVLRREGDLFWEARLLNNRGVMLAERGDADAAERDLVRAHDLYTRVGATSGAIGAQCERVRVALARGDLPGCLQLLDSVDAAALSLRLRSELELLRAKALVALRQTAEAQTALELAHAIWSHAGYEDPEGRLEAIQLTLFAGDATGALSLARRAQRSFAARGRRSYAAQAAGLALAATIESGGPARAGLRSGRRAASMLEAEHWSEAAQRVRLLTARAAAELGSPGVARAELAACGWLRRYGSVMDRVDGWHVEALVHLAEGDPIGAQRSALAGLQQLDDYRATFAAADVRAAASEIGVSLARLGLRVALQGDSLESLLRWAERVRANAMRLAPVTAPDDPELRALLTELRHVTGEIRLAERTGRLERSLLERRLKVEGTIRRVSRHATVDADLPSRWPGKATLGRALGSAALVELIELDGILTAVTLVDRRLTRHELGPAAAINEQRDWLSFALTMLSHSGRDGPREAAARAAVESSAEMLGQLLIDPVAERIEDRPLVLVPTASLHAVAWPLLPRLRGRPVVIAPSALIWLARQPAARGPRDRTVLVAGPDLRHARREVAALHQLYPDATVLSGREASVSAVLEALDGAKVAHLACHGRIRADSPLFSALELADGSLNAYELRELRLAPELVVLAACDLAVADARPGEELLGFAAALIEMGAGTILASVVPVPDAATRRLMTALHGRLAAGDSPAVALAKAQAALRPNEYPLAGFVCIGAG
jgi:hypothetical protein